MGMMRQSVTQLKITTPGQGLHDITREVVLWAEQQGMTTGLLAVFCRHTSASLCIQENAAPEVRGDVVHWLNRIAPENAGYAHNDEGADDMPAHLKSILTGVSLSIPVADGKPALGTWQGIYICEHRRAPHHRNIALHLIGD